MPFWRTRHFARAAFLGITSCLLAACGTGSEMTPHGDASAGGKGGNGGAGTGANRGSGGLVIGVPPISDAGRCDQSHRRARCSENGRHYCGLVDDGCGALADCGECPSGLHCGGSGFPKVCGAADDATTCTPITCQPPNGRYCGIIGDGCGSSIDCGGCPAGEVCGARVRGVCGTACPLCPMIPSCEAGTTSIRGTVYTGARSNPDPLYGALIYIPNIPLGTQLSPFPNGPTCDACVPPARGSVIASAVTASDGTFSLTNVPAGAGIPLVVQLGRWRRQTTIDVTACADNVLAPGTARLPRNRTEGDIPLTAIATGDVDAMECLFRKIGVDDAEFTHPSGPGRIHVYQANGARIDASTPPATALVGSARGGGAWSSYDQVILPCRGSETIESSAALGNLLDYVNGGGRVFTTHFGYAWLFQNGPLAGVGAWRPQETRPADPLTATIDTSFAKGVALAQWMRITGGLSNDAPPQILIEQPRHDLDNILSNGGAKRWIYSDPAIAPTPAGTPVTVQQFTADTPIGAAPDALCGRVSFSDFHVLDSRTKDAAFPAECNTNPLTPQERLLEFMLFDLASCDASDPPVLPPPPPAECPGALVGQILPDGGSAFTCNCRFGAFGARPCTPAECVVVCPKLILAPYDDLRACTCNPNTGPCFGECGDTLCVNPTPGVSDRCIACLENRVLDSPAACPGLCEGGGTGCAALFTCLRSCSL